MGYGTHPLPVGGVIQVFESLIIQYVIPVTGCATCPLPVDGVIVLYRCLNL